MESFVRAQVGNQVGVKIRSCPQSNTPVKGIGVVAGTFQRFPGDFEQQALLGKKLFENLSVGSIDAISIQSSEDIVSLKQGKDFWVVDNRYQYRADFSKVSELVKKIMAAKIGRRFDKLYCSTLAESIVKPKQNTR